MKKRSKRYKLLQKKKLKDKLVIEKTFDLIKDTCTSKIDESIDVSLRINLKQSKGGDFNLRTVLKLPNGNGKSSKLAVLCEQDKVDEAKKNGADIAGSDDLLENISKGKFNLTSWFFLWKKITFSTLFFANFKAPSTKGRYSTVLPGSKPHDAVIKIFALLSSILLASSFDANPPKTTECIAPILPQASIAITASGIIGI